MLPKEEGKPEAGYWGYIVAVSKAANQLPAMMESRDGTAGKRCRRPRRIGAPLLRSIPRIRRLRTDRRKVLPHRRDRRVHGQPRAMPCSPSWRTGRAALPPRRRGVPPLRQFGQGGDVAGRLGSRQGRIPDQQLCLGTAGRPGTVAAAAAQARGGQGRAPPPGLVERQRGDQGRTAGAGDEEHLAPR